MFKWHSYTKADLINLDIILHVRKIHIFSKLKLKDKK